MKKATATSQGNSRLTEAGDGPGGMLSLETPIPLKLRALRYSSRSSAKSRMVDAINYTLGHWEGLTRFMEGGRIEIDSNTVDG
jgi:hypothetical protein